MHRRHRPFLVLASSSLLALGVSACGSEDGSSDAATAETVATEMSSMDTAAASGEQDDATAAVTGDRIRLVELLTPRAALSPLSDDAFKLSRWSSAETLVVLDENGDLQPSLATAWTVLDDRSVRFEIRDGVTFHDGTPLDVAAVINALSKAAAAAPAPRILDGMQVTAEADPDAPTNAVIVRSAEPDLLLAQRLSSPQLSILAISAYAADGTVSPIGTGTGAFELTELNGTTTAKLDRFADYWGTPAAAPGIDVDFVADGTARAAALRTGTADIVESVPVAQAPNIDAELLNEIPMPRTVSLYLNNETGAFADAGLRAAAREAIVSDTLVTTVYEGHADESRGLFGPALPWAADRPARTEAAATDPTGTAITLATYSDRPELPEVAVQLEQQLEAAGFEVEQVVREYSQIETDALAGVFDAFILSRSTMLDSGDPVAFLASDFSCAGTYNLARLCNADIDAAIAAAAATPAGADRRAAVLAVEKLILDADAVVPLLHERVLLGEAAGVTNAVLDPRERVLITIETTVER